MTPDERELRMALEARSGEASPEFRRRLSGALQESRPRATVLPAIALATVIVLSLTSVGILLMARGSSRVSYGGAPSGTRYTVTTTLMTDQRGRVVACHFYPLPMPPILCGGVTVTNIDVASIAGTKTYANGVVETPVVRVVGTWDGHVLRLTEQPQPSSAAQTQPQPVAQTPPATSAKSAQEVLQELTRDDTSLGQRGIVLMEWGQGSDLSPYVVLAVADPTSVQYLYDTYGRLNISGWLQPIKASRPSPSPSPIAMPTSVQLSAPSSDVVWADVGATALYRSMDRGATWEQRTLPVNQPGQWPEISFVDAQQGWYSESGSPETQCNAQQATIWHTTDGGATWQTLVPAGIGDAQCKQGLSFVDATHGFLAAWDDNHRPTIYRTSDGGQTWKASTLPDPPGFVTQGAGIALRAGQVKAFGRTLLVSANDGQGAEYVFRSLDGGATWTYLARGNGGPTNVAFVTASRWLQMQGLSGGTETTDAGKTWHQFPNDYSDAAGVASFFYFGDDQVGYGTVRGAIHRTIDGGSHWTDLKTPGT